MNEYKKYPFDWVEYKGNQYLVRELTYQAVDGERTYRIADDTLSAAMGDKKEQPGEEQSIDEEIYCYAPVSALIIVSSQELAMWLDKNVTEMEIWNG